MSSAITNYFILVRIPNVLTTISNILLGYIFFTSIDHFDYFDVFILISISTSLYIGGMVSNDYFDIKIDKKERPWRPLPSHKISQKNALIIIIISFLYSLTISSVIIGWYTFIITLIMVTLIFLYNRVLKNTIWGPINMGVIRSLNVVLGSSQSIFLIDGSIFDTRFVIPLLSEFLYVSAITILSKNETKDFFLNLWNILPFIIYVLIFSIGIFIILGTFNYDSLIPLIIFSCIIIYSHIMLLKKNTTILKSVSQLITVIVILDSIFITDILGVYHSLILVLILITPVYFLSRKIDMS
jgi:4-hydroxybenzoate polyprenyltransferase